VNEQSAALCNANYHGRNLINDQLLNCSVRLPFGKNCCLLNEYALRILRRSGSSVLPKGLPFL
jgi:hypothetical protein